MITPPSPKNSPITRRVAGLFYGRRRQAESVTSSPGSQSESWESSAGSNFLQSDIRKHVGELSLHFLEESCTKNNANLNKNSVDLNNSSTSLDDSVAITQSPNNDGSIKNLIFSYKSRPNPLEDTKAPPKPRKTASFKIDGVPACVSRDIEKNARRNADKRRKRNQEKSRAAMSELHESISSLQTAPTITRKQRRKKVAFLSLPTDHPFYWDPAQLPPPDFPEEDRAYLTKLLRNPSASKSLLASDCPKISHRVELTLKKLYLSDWDIATIGGTAIVLFHPDSNPLNLSPPVTNYFYNRLNTLKASLEEGVEDATNREEYLALSSRWRKDFEEAAQNYKLYWSSPYM